MVAYVNCETANSMECKEGGTTLQENWVHHFDGQTYPFGYLQGENLFLTPPDPKLGLKQICPSLGSGGVRNRFELARL